MSDLTDFRYECGLDNLILRDFPIYVDDKGSKTVTIPHVNLLHKVITLVLCTKSTGLQPKELRFLRTELGMTQSQLGNIFGRDAQTIARWEKGETDIDRAAEVILRAMGLAHVQPEELVDFEKLASQTIREVGEQPIYIDASNPEDYRPWADKIAA